MTLFFAWSALLSFLGASAVIFQGVRRERLEHPVNPNYVSARNAFFTVFFISTLALIVSTVVSGGGGVCP